jgi:hypothetical protein
MTPREEFQSAIEHLDETITQLALLAICFRRLERDLWPEAKADFDYMTGTVPEKK